MDPLFDGLILENIGAASFKDYNPPGRKPLTPKFKVIIEKPQQNWILLWFCL
jgi:hypothetical protein